MTTYEKYILSYKDLAFVEILFIDENGNHKRSISCGYNCGSHAGVGYAYEESEGRENDFNFMLKKAKSFFNDKRNDEYDIQKHARKNMLKLLEPTLFGLPEMKRIEMFACPICEGVVDEEGEKCGYCEYFEKKKGDE